MPSSNERLRRSARWLTAGVLLVAVAARGEQSELPLEKIVLLGPQEMLGRSREYQANMQSALGLVLRLQAEAQKKKDVIRLNCVNDKLIQIRGHLAVATRAATGLNDAVAKHDDPERRHEITRLTILHQKVEGLKAEAQTCVGEDIRVFGKDHLEVEIDPNIPQSDPSNPALPVLEVIPRPTEASPTR